MSSSAQSSFTRRRNSLPLRGAVRARGEGGAQKARQRHAGDLDGRLEREEEPGARALVGRKVGYVLAVEHDGARRLRVDGVAHDDVAEGGLAGAVGAHENMGLAGGDGEVDVVEDLLLVDGGGKAGDGKQGRVGHGGPFSQTGLGGGRGARARRGGSRPSADRAPQVGRPLNPINSLGIRIR